MAGKSMQSLVQELHAKREHLYEGGGADRLAKQKQQGKLTARERVAALVDELITLLDKAERI